MDRIVKNLPDWINEKIFSDVLREKNKDFEKINNFEICFASKEGENFLTSVLRVICNIDLKDGNTQVYKFILKIPLLDVNTEDFSHIFFLTESDMYARIVPELEDIYTKHGLVVHFMPSRYEFLETPPCDYILMEDLQSRGFSNANRLEGLDEEHTKCALKKLAQWHAASAKRVESKGPYSEYSCSFFGEENRPMIEGMNKAFEVVFLDCLNRFNLPKELEKKIENYLQNLTDLFIKFGKVDEGNFNVLNHGDFWMNNFLFQHDDCDATDGATASSLKDIIFVDFQMPKYGSPAQDLFAILISSPKLNIKLQKFDELIAYYHQQLLQHLTLLKYEHKFPALDDLHCDLKRHGLWSFVIAQRTLAVVLLDSSDHIGTANIENFMSDKAEGMAFKKRMLTNPKYIEQVKPILMWLDKRGFLEIEN